MEVSSSILCEAEKKLGVIFNKVVEWMQSRRLKLNSDKTEYVLVTANNSIHRNVDTHSMMLGKMPVQLSNSVRVKFKSSTLHPFISFIENCTKFIFCLTNAFRSEIDLGIICITVVENS